MDSQKKAFISSDPGNDQRISETAILLKNEISKITQEQRDLLKESFTQMENETARNGLSIFMRLFQEYPNYKTIFPKFKHISDTSLMATGELQNHGIVYMAGLKDIIDSLNNDQVLAEQIKKIATSHKRKGVLKYHVENMLPMVLTTLKLSLPHEELTKDVEDAWTTLFKVIADLIERLK